MTIDQMLYVAARINDWTKAPHDVAYRAAQITMRCEEFIEAKEKARGMKARGLSPLEMIHEAVDKMSGMPAGLREEPWTHGNCAG